MARVIPVRKNVRKSDGSFDYVINKKFDQVVSYMLGNGLDSIVDLGSGVGDCLMSLPVGYKKKGYEYNIDLIEDHKKMCDDPFVEKKNILDLKKDDIEGYDVIYAYQPFYDEKLHKRFMNLVMELKDENQVFLFQSARPSDDLKIIK